MAGGANPEGVAFVRGHAKVEVAADEWYQVGRGQGGAVGRELGSSVVYYCQYFVA